MAEHLAYIFGTERDRVNCPFYCKIGACRHGNRCGRIHTTPTSSQTLLLKNFYQRPDMLPLGINVLSRPLSLEESQEHFDMFYEDVFEELSKFGEIECLHVCDNTADHMVGNVYVMFRMEEHAENAQQNLCGRYYSGQPINVEFSPVTDFREATCRQYEDNECNRGGNCNFIHLKRISSGFRRQLFGRDHHQLSRARSPYRHPTYEHNSSRSRRHSERDFYHQGHQRRNDRSVSPRRYRRERSRSPDGRGNRSFVREGSAERRAKIERWNREREEAKSVEKEENKNTGRDYHSPNRNVHGRQLPAKGAYGRGS